MLKEIQDLLKVSQNDIQIVLYDNDINTLNEEIREVALDAKNTHIVGKITRSAFISYALPKKGQENLTYTINI